MKNKTFMFLGLLVAVIFLGVTVVTLFMQGEFMAILIVLLFFAIFTTMLVSMVVYEVRKNKFKKFGKKQFARFVDIVKGNVVTTTVNDTVVDVKQYYCVKFQYKGKNGEVLEGKTEKNIELSDAEKLKRAYYFEVYIMNNKAMVLNFPTEQEIAKFSDMKNYKYCSYCGSKSNIEEKRCSKCGASQFEEIF